VCRSLQPNALDQSRVLIKQLLFDPLPDPALPTNDSQVFDWLFGFTKLKIPVTVLFHQHASTIAQQQLLAPQDDAASAVVSFTELLQTAPCMPYSTEMHTSVYICNFVGSVWESLTTHSPIKLKHSLLFNKTLQLHNVSSHAIAPKSRPDTMLVAENCTLLLGEDKHSDLAAAYQDLNRKRVDLSGLHYGPLKCMLGYVAAETTVQWCFIPSHADQVKHLYVAICCLLCGSACSCSPCHLCFEWPICSNDHATCMLQPVQVVGPRLDFFSIQDRVSLLLSLVQAYRLLAVMSKSVPPLPGRIPLYQEIATENSMCVSGQLPQLLTNRLHGTSETYS